MKKHPLFHSFLIRISSSGESGPWRIHWQDVTTGDRLFFMDMDKFLVFLQIFIAQNGSQDGDNNMTLSKLSNVKKDG